MEWRSYVMAVIRAPDATYSEFKITQHHETTTATFTLIPKIPDNTNLLIVINTIPSQLERRHTLRETWAKHTSFPIAANSSSSKSNNAMNIAYFFMIAFDTKLPEINKNVEREAVVHGDILRVNLNESYRGMVNKILLTFEWVTTLDIKPDFIAKADDDVYVKMPDLARWLQENSHLSTNLYTGFVHRPVPVDRRIGSRCFVSREQFGDDYFLPYCLGPFYIFSRDVFLGIVNESKVTEAFPVEDAFMGVLVKKIGLQPTYIGRHLFINNRRLGKWVLKSSGDKVEILSGIVLGDSLSSKAIKMIHHAYTRIYTST